MSGGIFIEDKKSKKLIELTETEYASEDLLQTLLVKYPNLLAGNQINPSAPRRWLLIKREAEIPDKEKGERRWSVDHLFVDQDGVPTLIEVKRRSDTRLRREVVGQMLDYAANALSFWPADKLEAQFNETCSKEGVDPAEKLNELLQNKDESENFWQTIQDNLNAGKVRLIFIADVIPYELQRIVEFLNEQMHTVEVLAIEIKQFVGAGTKSYVPRLFGQTVEAQMKKSGSGVRKPWDEESFFRELKENVSETGFNLTRDFCNVINEKAIISFGTGSANGSFAMKAKSANGKLVTLGHIWSNGRFEAISGYFGYTLNNDKLKIKYVNAIHSKIKISQKKQGKDWENVSILINKMKQSDFETIIKIYQEMITDIGKITV